MNEFNNIKSTVIPLITLPEKFGEYDYVIVTYTDEVLIDRGANFSLKDNWLDIRAFSENKELHAVKTGSTLRGRIRTDGEGEDTRCFEQQQKIWGTAAETENGKTLFAEDRGIVVKLPLDASKGAAAFLKVRSYLKKDAFEFTDYRVCGIEIVGTAKEMDEKDGED